MVSDLAFKEMDFDGNNSLDQKELAEVMREVAREFGITPPTDADIGLVFSHLLGREGEVNYATGHKELLAVDNK